MVELDSFGVEQDEQEERGMVVVVFLGSGSRVLERGETSQQTVPSANFSC